MENEMTTWIINIIATLMLLANCSKIYYHHKLDFPESNWIHIFNPSLSNQRLLLMKYMVPLPIISEPNFNAFQVELTKKINTRVILIYICVLIIMIITYLSKPITPPY
jgi:hypothetical protein